VAIVGAGLAGLAVAIQLARQGYSIIVFEKEKFPFHRVCGEYISMESWNFLKELGLELEKLNVPVISKLQVSANNGKLLMQNLTPGGFGISRFLLDNKLVQIARETGVVVLENTKVNDIEFSEDKFSIFTSPVKYRAKVACACFGKRSNLDVKWKRPFSIAAKSKLNNYIGIKYHIKTEFPPDTIALHNFKNGYCGLVKVEDDKYNLCYLTTADNLQQNKGDIKAMEKNILSENIHLKKIFEESEIINHTPVTISQISFNKKSQVEKHIIMIGDAAGMITPLCGNGMSIALQSGKIAATTIHQYLEGSFTRTELEKNYTRQWQKQFARRLRAGRVLQRVFGNKIFTNIFISLIKPFPKLVTVLINQTHGENY